MLNATSLRSFRALGSLFVLVSAIAATGCAPTGSEDLADDAGDDADAAQDGKGIRGGQRTTSHPEAILINGQKNDGTFAICTGALIAPRVVLTAGHCVNGFVSFEVVAPVVNKTRYAVAYALYDYTETSRYVNPNMHDVGLLLLDRDVQLDSYPTIAGQRLPWGTAVRNVGRIQDGWASYADVFVGPAINVVDGKNYGYPLSYVANEVIQPGDSGGPVYLDGYRHIVAVNSGGGGGTEILARVDLVAGWIDEQIRAWGAGAPQIGSPGAPGGGSNPGEQGIGGGGSQEPAPQPQDNCQGIDFAGTCDGDFVVWCEDGELWEMECEGRDTCVWREDRGIHDCQ